MPRTSRLTRYKLPPKPTSPRRKAPPGTPSVPGIIILDAFYIFFVSVFLHCLCLCNCLCLSSWSLPSRYNPGSFHFHSVRKHSVFLTCSYSLISFLTCILSFIFSHSHFHFGHKHFSLHLFILLDLFSHSLVLLLLLLLSRTIKVTKRLIILSSSKQIIMMTDTIML